jgi:hypothetical protein
MAAAILFHLDILKADNIHVLREAVLNRREW